MRRDTACRYILKWYVDHEIHIYILSDAYSYIHWSHDFKDRHHLTYTS